MSEVPLLGDPAFPALKARLVTATGLGYFADRDADLAHILRGFTGADGCAGLLARLEREGFQGTLSDSLVHQLTVRETYFFRHPRQFDALRDSVIPDCLRRNAGMRRLTVWSAGCANGAEIYSLAILLRRSFGGVLKDWQVTLLGTDIDVLELRKATLGLFRSWSLREMAPEVLEECFLRRGEHWQLRPEYREWVSFARHNLVTDPPPTAVAGCDLVLCRNVLIYFDPASVLAAAGHLRDALSLHGWLVAGPSDRMAEQHLRTIDGALSLYRHEDRRVEPEYRPPPPHAAPRAMLPVPPRPVSHVRPAERRLTAAPLPMASAAKLLAERTVSLACPLPEQGAAEMPPVIVLSGSGRYALPLGQVEQVVALPPVSPVPEAPPFSLGIIVVTGRMYHLLDLGRLCGTGPAGTPFRHAVLLRHPTMRAALAAVRAEDVEGWDTHRQMPPADRLPWVRAVAADGTLLLDGDALAEKLRNGELRRDITE